MGNSVESVAPAHLVTTGFHAAPRALERLGWFLIILGFPMGNTNVGLFVLLLGAIAHLVTGKKFDWFLPRRDLFYVMGWLFFGVSMVSGALSTEPILGLAISLAYFLLFFLIVRGSHVLLHLQKKLTFDRAMLVVSIATIIGSSYALYTYFGLGHSRASAVSVGINGLGTVSAFTALITFAYAVRSWKEKRWHSGLALIAMAFSLAALVLSFSRGGWLGFGVSIILFVFILVKHRKVNWKALVLWLVIGMVAVGITTAAVPSVQERFVSAFSIQSNLSRVVIWQTTLLMIKDHLVFGIGGGNYPVVYNQYLETHGIDGTRSIAFAHNIVLHMAAEFGLLGCLAFFAMVGIAAVRGWQVVRRGGIMMYAFYSGYWGMIAHDLVDNITYGMNVGGLFWLLTGLFVHLHYKQKRAGQQGAVVR